MSSFFHLPLPSLRPGKWPDTIGLLKVARGQTLTIAKSRLRWLDEAGRELAFADNAFRLSAGTSFIGPSVEQIRHRDSYPKNTRKLVWELNDTTATASVDALCQPMAFTALPVIVGADEEMLFFVEYVNESAEVFDAYHALWEMRLRVDGREMSCKTRSWNGRAAIRPGERSGIPLTARNFPDVEFEGTHEVVARYGGFESKPEIVGWRYI